MIVKELIEELKKFPPDATVYRDSGDFADDWRKVFRLSDLTNWGTRGVLIE
jgi:hypothetical protein